MSFGSSDSGAAEASPSSPSPAVAQAALVRHDLAWHGTGFNMMEAQLAAIRQAAFSVRLEIYIFTNSELGRAFNEALTAAAKRGVTVKVIVDAMGSTELPKDFFHPLIDAGGSMEWFNPPRLSSWSFRDHRKLLIVDQEIAFVGGCNIAPEYHGDGIEKGWRDGGMSASGPIVPVLVKEFEEQWEMASKKHLKFPPGGHKQRVPCGAEIDGLFIEPGFGANPLREALRSDLRTAKKVDITSAYFLPSVSLRRHLGKAVKRGAKVRVLLAGKSDVKLMQLASRSLYRGLLGRGIRIFEFQPQILHAKVIVVDDICYIGSSNLDPRSLRINFEIMLRVRDAKLAAEVRKRFEDDLAHSEEITTETWKGARSWWERFKQRVSFWILARLDSELAVRKLRTWQLRWQEKTLGDFAKSDEGPPGQGNQTA